MLVVTKDNVHHDGQAYGPGATLEMAEQEARALIDAGAAEPAPAGAVAQNGPPRAVRRVPA